jgi:hypothetical protein
LCGAPHFEFEAVLTGATYKGVDGFWEMLDDIQDTVVGRGGSARTKRHSPRSSGGG